MSRLNLASWPSATLLACLLLGAAAVVAQETGQDPTVTPAEEADQDSLGRETPLSSIKGFVRAAEAFEWDIAARYLDLRNLPSEVQEIEGATLAEQFYFILQRRQVEIDSDRISDRREGDDVDDLPLYRDELARVKTRDGDLTLLMQRVPGPEDSFIWKVSNVTVARVPELYEEFKLPAWVEKIQDHMPATSFLGIEAFKWVILLGAALILTPLVWAIAYGIARLVSHPGAPLYPEVKAILTGPTVALVIIIILDQLLAELGIGAKAYDWLKANTLATAFTIWFVWGLVNVWRARRRYRYEQEGRSDAAVLGRPVANAIKLTTLLVGLLVWLANAGIDITALLAGLGIGGIAIALALQKPIEDLFGAVSIYSQRPVTTGDLCKYGNNVGQVEEIGLRTTRIRTLANSLVSVPNAHFSTGIIENLTARTKIMYHPDLPLRYDTTADQLRQFTADLREMLREHPKVEDSSARVRVVEFKDDAIIVRVRIFVITRDFDEYLEVVEEVNLAILRIVEQAGAHFAQGARSVFIETAEPK